MTKKIKITDFLATCGMTLQRIKCVNSLITECQKKLLDSLFSTECPSVAPLLSKTKLYTGSVIKRKLSMNDFAPNVRM